MDAPFREPYVSVSFFQRCNHVIFDIIIRQWKLSHFPENESLYCQHEQGHYPSCNVRGDLLTDVLQVWTSCAEELLKYGELNSLVQGGDSSCVLVDKVGGAEHSSKKMFVIGEPFAADASMIKVQ